MPNSALFVYRILFCTMVVLREGFGFKLLLVMIINSLLKYTPGNYCCTYRENVPSLNIFIPVTTLEVIDMGNGGDTVTCSAQNVVDMQWSVSYSGIRRDVDLDMILDSVNQELAVTGGITMSSALISQSPNSIRSVMRTAPVSSGGQRVQVEFVCFGRTRFGGTFEEVAKHQYIYTTRHHHVRYTHHHVRYTHHDG